MIENGPLVRAIVSVLYFLRNAFARFCVVWVSCLSVNVLSFIPVHHSFFFFDLMHDLYISKCVA